MPGSVDADSSRPIPPNMADAPTIDTQGQCFLVLSNCTIIRATEDYGKAPSQLRSLHRRDRGLVPP